MNTSEIIRKRAITLAGKYIKKGSGSTIETLLNISTKSTMDITKIIKHTKFVIVGGLATSHYMPQRNTIDTDILVLVQNIEQLYKEFRNAGYKKTGALSIEGSTWISKDKEIIDVIESDEEWAEEAIKRPYFHDNLPVIALEYLVLMKFFSGRLQDIADISRMMALANDDQSKKVKIIIAKYLPSASEDLNSMIQLGKLELEK